MPRIDGAYFDGKSSQRLDAQLDIDGHGFAVIRLRNESRDAQHATFTDLNVSTRLGNTPRRICFPDGAVFETTDNKAIDAVQKAHQHHRLQRLLHTLESHWMLVLFAAVFVIVFVWGGARYGVPVAGKVIAFLLPPHVSHSLGQGTLQILDKAYFEPSALSTDRRDQLEATFSNFARQYPDQPLKFKFRQGGKLGPNAFALPDGTLVFTDELINLAKNDDELIAILGHEIGHVVHRHSLRRIIQDATLGILLVLITGDVSSVSSVFIATPALLLELSYSRHFETEADDFAYEFLRQNSIPPEAFATMMERLHAEQTSTSDAPNQQDDSTQHELLEQLANYLSTHPITKERIARFRN